MAWWNSRDYDYYKPLRPERWRTKLDEIEENTPRTTHIGRWRVRHDDTEENRTQILRRTEHKPCSLTLGWSRMWLDETEETLMQTTHPRKPRIWVDNDNDRTQRRNSRLFTISSLHLEQSPTRTLKWPGSNRVQITCNTSSAYHVQHVVLRAMWYEGTAQVLSLTECNSRLF